MPGGVTTSMGRDAPSLEGRSGSIDDFSAKKTHAWVTARVALTDPWACGSVPVKSTKIRSSLMVHAAYRVFLG